VQTVTVNRTAISTPVTGPVSDRTPPTLTISIPAGNIVATSKATFDMKGTASDANGIARVTWQSAAGAGTATGTTSWTIPGIPLFLGDNNIVIRAYDPAGNQSWRSILVIRN
jgi:hypothetical protein